jgi:hypothetical protein
MTRNRYDAVETPPAPKTADDVLYRHAKLSAQCEYFAFLLAQRKDQQLGRVFDVEECQKLLTLLASCGAELRRNGS